MSSDRLRLQQMLDRISQIERYAARGRDVFEREELVQTWVLHHLLIIGEAATRMSADFRALHPNIPWRQIIGMRNVLVHNYDQIDTELVWRVVEAQLRPLRTALEETPGGLALFVLPIYSRRASPSPSVATAPFRQ